MIRTASLRRKAKQGAAVNTHFFALQRQIEVPSDQSQAAVFTSHVFQFSKLFHHKSVSVSMPEMSTPHNLGQHEYLFET